MTQFTDLPFRIRLVNTQINVPNIALSSGDQWITVHETGNPDPYASAYFHAFFVDGGGGPDNVSYHFAVDDTEAIQILAGWRIGYHASDGCDSRLEDLGCFNSLAIETCINAGSDWEKTKKNLSKLIAMIVQGDERIVSLNIGAYSFDRIAQHNQWAYDHKDCPHQIRAEGSWQEIIDDAKSYAMTPIQYATPNSTLQDKLGDKDSLHISGAIVVRFRDWVQFQEPITPRQYAYVGSAPIGPNVAGPIQVVAIIEKGNGEKWFLSKGNARYLMTNHPFEVL